MSEGAPKTEQEIDPRQVAATAALENTQIPSAEVHIDVQAAGDEPTEDGLIQDPDTARARAGAEDDDQTLAARVRAIGPQAEAFQPYESHEEVPEEHRSSESPSHDKARDEFKGAPLEELDRFDGIRGRVERRIVKDAQGEGTGISVAEQSRDEADKIVERAVAKGDWAQSLHENPIDPRWAEAHGVKDISMITPDVLYQAGFTIKEEQGRADRIAEQLDIFRKTLEGATNKANFAMREVYDHIGIKGEEADDFEKLCGNDNTTVKQITDAVGHMYSDRLAAVTLFVGTRTAMLEDIRTGRAGQPPQPPASAEAA